VIGNGSGAEDGEVQFTDRWDKQLSAGRVPGLEGIDPSCISICLVGDFDKSPPTQRQYKRLCQSVAAIQQKLEIGRNRVWVMDAKEAAGIGRYFPVKEFRASLLP
jgi:hypothetical protein